MMDLWSGKISPSGRIVFEGGSEERDKVEWMIKYDKKPIRSAFPIIMSNAKWKGWQIKVIKDWPSLTVIERR